VAHRPPLYPSRRDGAAEGGIDLLLTVCGTAPTWIAPAWIAESRRTSSKEKPA
jgi:hypothetical protein